MQSRWRSTLCGSRVKTVGDPITIETEPSQILSTGGRFLPHKSKPALRSMPMIFLPTGTYDVVAFEDGRNPVRYTENADDYLDEMDMSDDGFALFDSKEPK